MISIKETLVNGLALSFIADADIIVFTSLAHCLKSEWDC